MAIMEQVYFQRKQFYDKEDAGEDCVCKTCNRSDLLKELLNEGTQRPSDCLSPTSPPLWFDREKLIRGQAVFHRHFLSVIVSNLVGLLCLLSYEPILKALVFTGRSSSTKTAFKRYLSTINHIRRWYSDDIFDPNTSASRSIQLVRRMHIRSHADAKKALAASPSQSDMVVTQWAFFGLVLTHGEQLGMRCTKEEEDDLVHFWKSIGYLMGIEDRYNLGFGGLEEVRSNCHTVIHKVIVPSLKSPPAGSSPMSDAMLDGVHVIVRAVDPRAFTNFTRNLFSLENDEQYFSFYSRFILNLMIWNFGTALHLPMIGTFLRNLENGLLIFALYVCNLLPTINAYYTRCKQYITTLWQGMIGAIIDSIKMVLVMFKLQCS